MVNNTDLLTDQFSKMTLAEKSDISLELFSSPIQELIASYTVSMQEIVQDEITAKKTVDCLTRYRPHLLRTVRILDLSNCKLPEESMKTIGALLPNLERADLSFSTAQDKDLVHLKALPITYLNLYATSISVFQQFTKLTHLEIDITGKEIGDIFSQFKQLRLTHLYILGISDTTVPQLRDLLEHPTLQSLKLDPLELSHYSKLSYGSVSDLQRTAQAFSKAIDIKDLSPEAMEEASKLPCVDIRVLNKPLFDGAF